MAEHDIPYEKTIDYYFETNPEEKQAHFESADSLILSDEEKTMLEREFFAESNPFRTFLEENFIDNKPIEDLVKEIHEKYIRSHGKLEDLRDNNRFLKNIIKDLKNEVNGLKDTNYKLQGSSDRDQRYGNEFGMIPPQSIDMEEQLISSYFKNPSFMQNFNQPYLNLMFYKEAHRIIHSGMINTQNRLTQTNVSAYLRKIEQLEVVGGSYNIKQIADIEGTNDPLIAKSYIEQLEQHFLAREVIRFSTEIQREAFLGKTVDGVKWSYEKSRQNNVKRKKAEKMVRIDDYVEHIRDLSFRVLDMLPLRFRKYYNLSETVKEIKKNVRDLIYRQGKPIISTGYVELDRPTHGVRQNKLYLVGARPKNGKTTFAVNLADNVMAQNKPVGFLSYELTYEEILYKFIAKRALIDLEKFEYFDKDTPFTKAEQKRFDIATKEVEQLPLSLRGGKPSSLDAVVAQCQQMKIMNPDMAMIVVDGLQAFASLVPPKGNKSDYFYHVLTVLKKDVAEELNMTVILNAQLKGVVETYRAKKPKSIADFSDCKGIPEVADGAFLLWRPEHYFPEDEKFKGWINVHPVELRSSGRKDQQFKLASDIKYALVNDYKK